MTAVSAMAQDSGSEIEEIIVTAMRRSVPLTEVPSNLTAYDGEILKNRGVETFADLDASYRDSPRPISIRAEAAGEARCRSCAA